MNTIDRDLEPEIKASVRDGSDEDVVERCLKVLKPMKKLVVENARGDVVRMRVSRRRGRRKSPFGGTGQAPSDW